ncbi:MAG: hypothetical protein RLZZ292_2052, partial [Bacteroidota bacterium]
MSISAKSLIISLLLIVCSSFALYAQPVNDECIGAITLSTTTSTATKGTFVASTQNSNVGCGLTDNSVWYKFKATKTSHLITFANKQVSTTAFLYTGSCSNLQSTNNCFPVLSYTKHSVVENLTIGTTYFLELSTLDQDLFAFTIQISDVPPAPSNDNCVNALSITPSASGLCTTPTKGSTLSATSETIQFWEYDVWYKFKATSPDQQVKLYDQDNYAGFLYGITATIVDANCATSGTIYGEYNGAVNGQKDSLYTKYKPLVVGKDYLVRVRSNAYYLDFAICVFTPTNIPSNQSCATGITLPNNSYTAPFANSVAVNTTDAVNTPTDNPNFNECSSQSRKLYYKFLGTGKTMRVGVKDVTFVGTNSVWGDEYNLVVKESCGTIVAKKCNIESTAGTQSLLFSTQNGVTYQVVIEEPTATGSHTINLALSDLPPPPANDEKAGSVSMTISPNLSLTNWVQGDVSTATISNPNLVNYSNTGDRDIWYKFKATAKVHQLFIRNFKPKGVDPATAYMTGYFLLIDATLNSFVQSGGITWSVGGIIGDTTNVFKDLQIGKNYYLLFASSTNPTIGEGYTFEMAMRTPPIPANDECTKAKVLPMNTNWACDNTVAGSTAWSLGINTQRDIWYQFTATQPQHKVSISNVVATNTSNPIAYEVHYLTECGFNGYELPASKNGMITDLTVGKKYFIQILTYAPWGNDVLFDICVTTPTSIVANASCDKAVVIPTNPDDTPTKTVSGVTSYPHEQHFFGAEGDDDAVWYKFTATNEWHQLKMLDFQGITGFFGVKPLIKIYKHSNCEYQNVSYTQEPYLIGCEIGKDYEVKICTEGWESRAKFTFAITTVPRPLNDLCADAVSLAINPDSLVGSSSPVRFHFCTPSNNINPNESDVWYKFVATEKNIRLRVQPGTPPTSNWFLPEMQLWEGTDCNNLTKRWENTKDWSFDPFVTQPLPTLKKGATYYIRMHEFNNWVPIFNCPNCNYKVSIHKGENSSTFDECETPINLSVNTNQTCSTKTSFKVKNASLTLDSTRQANDAILLPWMTINNDVWTSFVAKSTTHFVEIDGVLNEKVGISTDSCATSTIQYKDLVISNGKNKLNLYYLNVGTRYYLRMLNVGDSLSVCITTPPPPPVNDAWQNAVPLTMHFLEEECTQGGSFTTQWATPDVLPFTWGCHPREADVWFKFKATSTQHWIKFDTLQIGFEYFVYKLNPSTNDLENVICDQYVSGTNKNGYLTKGLIPDSTYFLSIAPAFGTRFDVPHQSQICVSVDTSYYFQTPVNDWCQNAITIVPHNFEECDNTVYHINEATLSYYDQNVLKREVWFKFEAKHSKYLLSVKGTKKNTDYFPVRVHRGACPNGFINIYDDRYDEFVKNLTIGETYYIQVFQRDELNDFKICLIVPPPAPSNDEPCAAKPIAVNANNFPILYEDGNTVSATQSNVVLNCTVWPFKPQQDIWYKFKATQKQHWVRLFNTEKTLS